MTKEELIKHFQEQKRIAEKEIAFWQAQPDDGPEKPEPRHGDFGYDRGFPRLTLISSNEGLLTAGQYHCGEVGGSSNHPDPIFGNIFDLLKECGEKPKKTFHSERGREGRSIMIDVDNNEIWLGNTGDSDCYSYEIAYKIWIELGKGLFTLRRKENKCS